MVWLNFKGVADQINRCLMVSGLISQHSEHMQAVEMIWLLDKNCLVPILCLLQPTVLVMIDGFLVRGLHWPAKISSDKEIGLTCFFRFVVGCR